MDDTRNYEKIATSLIKDKKYRITILGIASANEHSHSEISFKPWGNFSRLSFGRIGIQFAYRRRLAELKPDLIICTTFELLFISVLFRILNGTKIVYDIREDYLKNLWFQKFYPFGIRHVLGLSVRVMEFLVSPFISGFTLAEKTYRKDIGFVRQKSLTLENKSLPIIKGQSKEYFSVIFTGTVSSYSHAKESIELYLQISDQLPKSALTVIGYVPVLSYRLQLESIYGSHPNIKLKLSDTPVPHVEIMKEISIANLAIIGYKPNPVNTDKVPTKLYEYTAARLPYLVQSNSLWANLGRNLGGAIPIEFEDPTSTDIMKYLDAFDEQPFAKSGFLWDENEIEFRKYILDIINESK